MGVDVDESWRDDLPLRVDHASGRAPGAGLDRDDPARADAHVGLAPGRSGAVDQLTASDQEVVHARRYRRRARQISSAGHCRDHSSVTYAELVVAVSGGRTSIKSSISNPLARS